MFNRLYGRSRPGGSGTRSLSKERKPSNEPVPARAPPKANVPRQYTNSQSRLNGGARGGPAVNSAKNLGVRSVKAANGAIEEEVSRPALASQDPQKV